MKLPASQTERLLQSMAELPVPEDEPARAVRRRDQVVAHVSSLVKDEQRAAQRRRWRPLVAALLAAAALILVFGAVRTAWRARDNHEQTVAAMTAAARARAIEGTVLFARNGALSPLTMQEDTLLQSGDELRTAALGGATVVLSTGIVVNVGPATTFSIGAVRQEPTGRDDILLTMGRVDVAVPKLPQGRSFAVRTPDSEVVVHGTRFSVTVSSASPGAPATTSVQVAEGRVSVLHAGAEAWLTRGESWSSTVAPAAGHPESEIAHPAAIEEQPSEPSASGHSPVVPNPPKTSPQSSLAEENRLFQVAMEAKRRGDDRSEVGTLDQLLSRYPNSPLAPDARVERFRALKRLGDDTAAAREARRYLAENPDGFARDEARDTVLTPAPSSSRPAH